MDSKEVKRQELADIARVLFTEFGYKSVSMDQLAMHARVAKGTIYLYFKDKEEILTYLVKQVLVSLRERFEQIENTGLNLLDEIHQIVYGFLMYRHNQKFVYKIMSEARQFGTPSACRAIKQIDHEILAYLDKRLHQAVDMGQMRPVNTAVLSFIIVQVYSALAFEWEEEHEKLDEKQIADSVKLFLKEGLIIDEKAK